MVIHRLSCAHESPFYDAQVRGRPVRSPGPVATLPDALLVHDVGLSAQASRAGLKSSNGSSTTPRMKGVRHSILFNWRLRTRVDRGSVDSVNRVGGVWTGQDVDEFLLVCQGLCQWYCG